MATFSASTIAGVNSDLLFPALRGGSYHVLTRTDDTYAIQYDDDGLPGSNWIVTFHSDASNFDYDLIFHEPIAGTFHEITLSNGVTTLARWITLEDAELSHVDNTDLPNQVVGSDPVVYHSEGGDDVLVTHGTQRADLVGNGGDDTFRIGNVAYHSTIDGGQGYDTIAVREDVLLWTPDITNVEALTFASLSDVTVTFYGLYLGQSYQQLTEQLHVTGDSHSNGLIFTPSSLGVPVHFNLSDFTFTNWNSAVDKIQIEGHINDDTLTGSAVTDHIDGKAGEDVIKGGLGRDFLTGGGDHDIFDFDSIKESGRGGAHRDKILDFQRGVDDIDLRTIDAKTGGGNQKFDFIGKQDFHDQKGELRYADHGSKVTVQGDVNGDGKADFEIWVKAGALHADDFYL